ncbi:MAG TPA: YicC family protein [Pseudomonadales bacterium]|nr:YicC family protein [Pseudomonadales bacterium]
MHSMTAFARKECVENWGTLVWEIRSVNHRYLEPGFRLPDTFRFLEPELRERLRKHLQRGKVDCSLQFQAAVSREAMTVDTALVQRYVQAADSIQAQLQNPASMSAVDFLFRPGVLCENAVEREVLSEAALSLFAEALKELQNVRAREGDALVAVIRDRLQKLREQAAIVRAVLPEILAAQKQKLRDRLSELTGEINQDRVEQELVHLAQRCDVDEELDRLDTHIKEVERIVSGKETAGRKLDFMMQELNREANTLSSKSISAVTTQAAVEMKVLIEQMREQVQNIE